MINFGLIGLGKFGQNYLRLLQTTPGVKLLGTASRSTGSVEEVLGNRAIDAVVIATPSETHFTLAKQALEIGKHVLLEKPMALSLDDAHELAEAVKSSGKILLVGHQYLYNDHFRFLKAELQKGTLGEVNSLFAEHCYRGPSKEVDIIWDAATHVLATVDYLFEQPSIAKVSGLGTADRVGFQVEFIRGLLLNYAGNRLASKKIRRLVLAGQNGLAYYDEYEEPQKLKIFTADQVLTLPTPAGEPLKNELLHFLDCVRNNQTPLTDIEHGLRVTAALDFISKNLV